MFILPKKFDILFTEAAFFFLHGGDKMKMLKEIKCKKKKGC
jgi:hypothetical protein